MASAKGTYLLSSPGFFPKLLFSFLAILMCAAAIGKSPEASWAIKGWYDTLMFQLMQAAHSWAWWSLLAMLSSSCCVLQLLLNLCSVGCAGFNTWLGPCRPFMLAATLASQCAVWALYYEKPLTRGPSISTCSICTLTLAFLPELLALRLSLRPPESASHSDKEEVVWHLSFSSLGCVACETAVSAVIKQWPGVAAFTISTERQEAWVRGPELGRSSNSQQHSSTLASECDGSSDYDASHLCEALAQAGFPATFRSSSSSTTRTSPTTTTTTTTTASSTSATTCNTSRSVRSIGATSTSKCGGTLRRGLFLLGGVVLGQAIDVDVVAAGIEANKGVGVQSADSDSLSTVPVWAGESVQDLHREYSNIFRYGNRNAAAHLWSTFLLERSPRMTPERIQRLFGGFCAVSGSPVNPHDYNRYRLTLPKVPGDHIKSNYSGFLHYCCWPCVCDTQDFFFVDTLTVSTAAGPREYHFLVLGNPCEREAELERPFLQPFGHGVTTLKQAAPEVRCGPRGELLGATLSDHGYPIIGMFFDAVPAATSSSAVEKAGLGAPEPGRVRHSASGVAFQDEFEWGPMCTDRADNGYNSGMGEIFRKVAAVNPISHESGASSDAGWGLDLSDQPAESGGNSKEREVTTETCSSPES